MPRFVRIEEPPENGWTEFYIQRRLVHCFNGMKYMVPNMKFVYGIMDLFCLRYSGYGEEIEVKVTCQDFKADAKKFVKHGRYASMYKGGVIDRHVPNKFSYALPGTLGVTPKDIPDYAGLYIVKANGSVVCEKWPEFLHKEKQNWDGKVARSTSLRLLDARGYYDT